MFHFPKWTSALSECWGMKDDSRWKLYLSGLPSLRFKFSRLSTFACLIQELQRERKASVSPPPPPPLISCIPRWKGNLQKVIIAALAASGKNLPLVSSLVFSHWTVTLGGPQAMARGHWFGVIYETNVQNSGRKASVCCCCRLSHTHSCLLLAARKSNNRYEHFPNRYCKNAVANEKN